MSSLPALRTSRLALPTGQRVEVRSDLSVRVMLRSGLIKDGDEFALLDALDDVALNDRAQGRALQDALVLHALMLTKPAELDALAEPDFLAILQFAISALSPAPVEVEDDEEVETEDEPEEEVLGVVPEPAEDSIEDAFARLDKLPKRASFTTPESARMLDDPVTADAGQ